MMKRHPVASAIAGILLLALLGIGGWWVYGRLFRTYAITRRFHAGEQWRYQVTQSLQFGQQSITLNLFYTETVKEANSDGTALVERVLHGDAQTLHALQQSAAPLGEIPKRTVWRVHPDGRETPLSREQAHLSLGSAGARLYPLHPVRIGEQWERESEMGSIRSRFLCRLEGIIELEGNPCYKIVARLESLPGSLPQVRGTLTSYIDRQSGWVRQEEGTITMTAGSLQMSSQIRIHGQPVHEGTNRRGARNG